MMEPRRKAFRKLGTLLFAGLLLGANVALPLEATSEPLSAFPQSLLAIRSATGKVINFKVWTADTPQREEQGLMFIRQLDEHAGMLFIFPDNQPVTMWMKNTYISLDLLFMNAQGRIDFIAPRATPLSEAIIGPLTPEYAVLELNGGTSERLGIQVGDVVMHQNFKKSK